MSSSPVSSTQKPPSQKPPQKKSSNNRKFVFGLASPVARQQQLLFSEYHSDVIFRVGSAGELIHAHKMILTVASEVFYAQFNGDFAESKQDNCENPVEIEDIEPATFREVLRFIYCEKVFLTAANVMDIYYASEKYLLTGLNGVCENFLKTSINEANVLKVFNDNRQYGLTKVDEFCLKIIRDNPIKCFETKDFLTLSEPALQLIVASESMNCQMDQLSEAVQKWCKTNESEAQFKLKVKDMQCRKLYSFSTFDYYTPISTHLQLKVMQNLYLYGIGVFVGKRDPTPPVLTFQNEPTERYVNITVTVEPHNVSITKKVPLKKDLFVQDIVFEKLTVSQECQIKVNLVSEVLLSRTEFFCLNEFKPVDSLGNVGLTVCDVPCPTPNNPQGSTGQINQLVMDRQFILASRSPISYNTNKKKVNCVAYLLCNADN